MAIKDTFYTYLNENGKEFTDWYDKELVDVGWISFSNFNNKGFCVRKNNKWGIFDNKGKVLLPFEYDEPIINLRNASEPLEIQKNGLIGLIDSTGKIIVQPQYSRMEGYYNGYVQVLKNGKWDLIDINGKERSAPIYDSLLVNRYFKFAKYGSKWGIIDRDVRNYKINDISLNGHFAQVKVNTQWGIVDSNLKPLIEPQLDFIDEIKSSFIVGKSKNKWQVFNTKGERISSELDSTERYDIDFLWVKKNGKWGEIDTNGIFTLMPTLSDKEQGEKRGRRGDNNSFFEVQIGEKHGAKNKEGKIVVPVTYDGVDVNSNYSYIKVRKGDLFGFYYNPDSYDFVKCEPQYDEIEGSKSSHINFRKGNKWGLISIVKSFNYSDRAEITIPAMYDKQFEFTEDNCRSNWARVSKDGKSFYIDEKNNRVFSTTDFDDCKRITQNLIAIRKDLKWGFINCEGNIVIEKFFDEVEGFTVRKGNKWGMIDEKGNFLIAPQFQEISGNGGDGMLTVDKDNVKNLHINLQGEIILRH